MAPSTSPFETPIPPSTTDVLVVGGGINGCGIARDLSGRGVRVLLCEQDDLAAHTSSASTKLIHGGLRYLEYGEFGLVRKALAEREVLLRVAPHLIAPMRFVMPHDPGMRPAWMIRLGLWLYDHLARREVLPASRAIDLRRDPAGAALQPGWRRGFAYADGWVDDARLVVLNARDAADRRATVLTRTRCTALQRTRDGWRATLQPRDGGPAWSVHARVVVNAAGPWAESLLRGQAGIAPARHLRLVRGSHIVVPRLFDHDSAYLLQASDRRVVFAIPYERDYTLIGT
ncbi:MAG: glycerol-3-phosphate dehydrogenase, partial [Tepidimonas taiwanensis]|nr:glycerol-3-phosphate dehydrogenase [Tepidimonas taiwanensis]